MKEELKPTQKIMATIEVVYDTAKDRYIMYLDGVKKGSLHSDSADGVLDAVRYSIEYGHLFY